MYAVGRLSSYISQGVYTVSGPFHPFGGAVDIIVVQQQDGSFKSSPWYVKFGKFQGVLKTAVKVVNINVNGVEADFNMYLDHKGEAHFLREVEGEECESTVLSPLSSGDEADDQSQNGKVRKAKSYDITVDQPDLNSQSDVGNGKIIARTNSRRSRIFGLMFGRKSMKEDSRQREGGDDNVKRATSLERAEIAADLLDVKWSTNLSNDQQRTDEGLRLSTTNMSPEEADKDMQVSGEETQDSHLVNDFSGSNFDHSDLQHIAGLCNEEIPNHSYTGNSECSNGVNSPKTLCPRSLKESLFEGSVPYVENKQLSKLVGDPIIQHHMDGASDKKVKSVSVVFPGEESGNLYIYSQTPESSRVTFDSSDFANFSCSCGECEVPQVKERFLLDKVYSKPRWTAIMDNTRLLNVDGCGKFPNTEAIGGNEGSSFSTDAECVVTESNCLYDIHLLTSEFGEAGMLEIVHQETITKRLTEQKITWKKPVEDIENQSLVIGPLHCVPVSGQVGLEDPSRKPGAHVQIFNANQVFHSIDEADHRGVCVSSSLGNLITSVQEEEYLGEANEMTAVHNAQNVNGHPQESNSENILTKPTTSSIPPHTSDEDQFVFSDINDFVPATVHYEDSDFTGSVDAENSPLVSMNNIQESEGSNDMNLESNFSSGTCVRECSLTSSGSVTEESRTTSIPMRVPRSPKSEVGEVERIGESLPNFRSHIEDLEMSDIFHNLSHSFDSHPENLKRALLGNDLTSSLKSVSDTEPQLTEEDLTGDDIRTWEEIKNMSTEFRIEISLCKHFLYEGMGADAASQAFDAEKVDLQKFISLGPGIVKNDKLIVRMDRHYFPWDAAAPIILGMLTLGPDQSLKPEGMICVEHVEKTVEGAQSRGNEHSGGSWRLWPFTFKRLSSAKPVQPVPDITNSFSVNASDSISNVTETITTDKIELAKKKVKSLVPTSEQLATLNLKDGQNVVTFTFSTAMLGNQQVDARIYLWKWNTRIVISDVDGTITKSDVLGQFMPLVGKDWSQTGVAHLFSAIKENGYQLLFLSARAISQAYLTRQFLFNLKQDGKALPDGPVVISPDGLFPSLFREVIRRAPHEFKIACLKDIKELFPPDCNPFYAGFGNRDTDEFSYLKVGIPKGKIFIINAKGEVSVNHRVDRKSYTSLHALVNGMFPAISSAEQEEFNSWNYWKMPLPDISS